MERRKIETFDNLKHGDKIISPIDNEVTEFYVSRSGDKYLAGKTSLFDVYQFDSNDFYFYNGKKEVGEVDKDYFKWLNNSFRKIRIMMAHFGGLYSCKEVEYV